MSVASEGKASAKAEALRFFELCLTCTPYLVVMSHQQEWKGRAWARKVFNRNALEAAADWTLDEMSGVEAYVPAARPHYYWEGMAAVVKLPASRAVDLASFPVQPSFAVSYGESLLQAVWLLNDKGERFEARSLSQAIARRLGGGAAARLRVPGTKHSSEEQRAKLILAHELPHACHDVQAALRRVRARSR